jgi:hypothetical protein
VNDSWIAGTAMAPDVPIVTQDDDFQHLGTIVDRTVVTSLVTLPRGPGYRGGSLSPVAEGP